MSFDLASTRSPRPLKLVAASEQQKDKILKMAKKLEAEPGVQECVHTSGHDTEAAGEKKRARAANEAEKAGRGGEPGDYRRRDRSEKTLGDGTLGLRCLYTNANSVIGKMEELGHLVAEWEFGVVGITESWANEGVLDAELALPGYQMYRRDRIGARGGGLLLYVADEIRSTLHEGLTECGFDDAIWVEAVAAQRSMLIGLCYRSPSSTMENDEELGRMMRRADELCNSRCMMVMGDFNFPNVTFRDRSSYDGGIFHLAGSVSYCRSCVCFNMWWVLLE